MPIGMFSPKGGPEAHVFCSFFGWIVFVVTLMSVGILMYCVYHLFMLDR